MRDWSELLNSVSRLSYDRLVIKGKEVVGRVLDTIEKYTDSDSADIMLVGLAAYTATVDDELSPVEISLVNDVIGVNQKDFEGFIRQVKGDKKIIRDLTEVVGDMSEEEVNDFATLLCLIFAVDGKITEEEVAFMKELCS